MAKKAADKCKYLAKYIYVKQSLRKTGGGAEKRWKPLQHSCPHPVLEVFRKLSPFDFSYIMVSSIDTTACLWAFLIPNYTNYSDMKGNDLTSEKNVWFLYA